MIEITLESAIEGVAAIVEEFGENYVYDRGERDRCDYVREGEPSCLVGKFLAAQGVSLERLEKADTSGVFSDGLSAGELLEQLRKEGVIQITPGVLRFLGDLQGRQDFGTPWGEALKLAKTVV